MPIELLASFRRIAEIALSTSDDAKRPNNATQAEVPTCKCDYYGYYDGCMITKAAPSGLACKCSYLGWTSTGRTCKGELVKCYNEGAFSCVYPSTGIASCLQGGGNCAGYAAESCDCDHHSGGCIISKAAPRETACKCKNKGINTCGAILILCPNIYPAACTNPDTSYESCVFGGGNCKGY